MSPSLFRLFVFSLSSFRLFAFVFSSFRYGAFVMSPRNNEKTKWHKSATIGFRGEDENVSVNQRLEHPSCGSDWAEKHKLGREHWNLPPLKFRWIPLSGFRKSNMSKPIRGQGAIFFLIGPKSTNLVENVETLLPVKFRWIRFSGFRVEVENVWANQRPGQPYCFIRSARKAQTW